MSLLPAETTLMSLVGICFKLPLICLAVLPGKTKPSAQYSLLWSNNGATPLTIELPITDTDTGICLGISANRTRFPCDRCDILRGVLSLGSCDRAANRLLVGTDMEIHGGGSSVGLSTMLGGQTSLMVWINFERSVLVFSRLETFWDNLLFSDLRRVMTSLCAESFSWCTDSRDARSLTCVCKLRTRVGSRRQDTQVHTPT